jgi:hypothetical protein
MHVWCPLLDSIDLTAGESALSEIFPEATPEGDLFSEVDFNNYFGIVANEDLVIVRPYSDDDDDKILEELRPKYVVMYDPDPAFVRRLEVSLTGGSDVLAREATERNVSALDLPRGACQYCHSSILLDLQRFCRGAALSQQYQEREGRV